MAEPRPLIGLAAGLVAGLAASAAMAAFQSIASGMADDRGDDPATVKAADAAARAATGAGVPARKRDAAGQAVHYVTGTLLGGAYGLIAEYLPGTTSGFGTAYGVVTSLALDEGAVPAAGLAPPPTQVGFGTHAYGMLAHLIYGAALEAMRATLVERR